MSDVPEAVIREFNDRGILWLLESPANLRDFVRILAEELADRLDFSRAERINRSFIPDNLHKQEADLLFRVPYRDSTEEVMIYLLMEHQSSPDPTMPLRLFSYIDQIWEVERRAWQDSPPPRPPLQIHLVVPIVFYTGAGAWTTPIRLSAMMQIPEALSEFEPRFKVLFLSLRDTAPEALTRTESAIAWALRALKSAEDPLAALSAVLSEAVSHLAKLPEEAQAEWKRAMHYLLLLVRHKRQPQERDTLYGVVYEAVDQRRKEEVQEMVMTDAEWLKMEGRQEGLQQGLQEGRRQMLLELLEFKFGPLSEETTEAVNSLAEQQLTVLSQQILTAKSLADLGL